MPIAPMPPRLCPICKERLWEEDRISRNLALRFYFAHVHNTHPEFQRWNSRLVWKFWFGVVALVLAQFLQLVVAAGLRLEIIWFGLLVTTVAPWRFRNVEERKDSEDHGWKNMGCRQTNSKR